MGKYGYHVIDADGHGGDLPNWQGRLPKEYAGHWEERKAKIAKQFANLVGVDHAVGKDAVGLCGGRRKMKDEEWIALGGDVSDEEYNRTFLERFSIALK